MLLVHRDIPQGLDRHALLTLPMGHPRHRDHAQENRHLDDVSLYITSRPDMQASVHSGMLKTQNQPNLPLPPSNRPRRDLNFSKSSRKCLPPTSVSNH